MKRLERVAQEGNTKIREIQAAECVMFLAELLELPVTVVVSMKIRDKPLHEWLTQKNFNAGRVSDVAQLLQSVHS